MPQFTIMIEFDDQDAWIIALIDLASRGYHINVAGSQPVVASTDPAPFDVDQAVIADERAAYYRARLARQTLDNIEMFDYVWQSTVCPWCHVPAGRPCVSKRDGLDCKTHPSRIRAFELAATAVAGGTACRYCGRPIHLEGDHWYHADRYASCSTSRGGWAKTIAEPTDSVLDDLALAAIDAERVVALAEDGKPGWWDDAVDQPQYRDDEMLS